MTQVTLQPVDLVQSGEVDGVPSRLQSLVRRVKRPWQTLVATPHVGTWVGVGLTTLGAVLLTVAWGRTAGLTDVGLQIPYVVSAGFSGLGFIAVGLTVVSLTAKRADARERIRQLSELRELVSELRQMVAEDNSEEARR